MSVIAIACPYPLDSRMGNVVTAERIAGILEEQGHEVRVSHGWDGGAAEILLVLHAVKGAEAARRFLEEYPEGKVLVLLTGTDLYRDLPEGSLEGLQTLARADRLVVMTELGVQSIPEEFHHKTVVVPNSLEMPVVEGARDASVFGISVVGHLRAVKNPFLAVEVLARHPEWREARVWQVGAALDEEMSAQAKQWEAREPRYRWLGGLPREEGLSWMKKSALTVNSSWMEGGASAVLEAMSLGVPVLASRVSGNEGLMGRDHGGFFEAGNATELEGLLGRTLEEPSFLEILRAQGRARASHFSREAEAEAWRILLAGL
jgi:putative glycosyltransferase (TIGR04348 family)